MSNIHLLTSSLTLHSPTLMAGITSIATDFCCYHVFKMALSPPKAYLAASLGGALAFAVFCPRSEKSLLGTSLLYLGYKTAHYFLSHRGAPASRSSSNITLTFTKSASELQPAPPTTTAAPKSATPPAAKPSATSKPPASQSSTVTVNSDSAPHPAAPTSTSAAPKQSPAAKPAAPSISRIPASQNLTALVSSAPKSAPKPQPQTATPASAPVAAQSPAPKEPLRKIPSVKEITKRFDALTHQFTLRLNGPINVEPFCPQEVIQQEIEKKQGFTKVELDLKMRTCWNFPEIVKESADLVKDAAAQLAVLYYELIEATKNIEGKDERLQAMARLLMSDERFSKRFYPSNTKTVLHIYRFVRGLCYILHCPTLVHNDSKGEKLRFWTDLKDADVLPFHQPGTSQYACSEAYNKVIDIFAPLKPYLSDEINAWLVKDEQGQPFEIIPRKVSNQGNSEKK